MPPATASVFPWKGFEDNKDLAGSETLYFDSHTGNFMHGSVLCRLGRTAHTNPELLRRKIEAQASSSNAEENRRGEMRKQTREWEASQGGHRGDRLLWFFDSSL
jgi:hypothetical protein